MNIPTNLLKRSVFAAKIGTVFEKMRVYAPISTIIRASAKTIDLPELTVDDAVNHGLAAKNSIGTASATNSTITIDQKTDKSVDYTDEDFVDDKVGFKKLTKEEILKVITKKLNSNVEVATLAGATAETGTIDLSTSALVNSFLSSVAVDAGQVYFS
jgi:hypothetical protein